MTNEDVTMRKCAFTCNECPFAWKCTAVEPGKPADIPQGFREFGGPYYPSCLRYSPVKAEKQSGEEWLHWNEFRLMCRERFGRTPEEIDECLKSS